MKFRLALLHFSDFLLQIRWINPELEQVRDYRREFVTTF